MEKAKHSDLAEKTPSQRLREALDAMHVKNEDVPTAAALCERAGVSRNTLYRYHRDILSELHKLQENIRRDKSNIPKQKITQLSEENRKLKRDIDELAALVDHYFAAWQECSVVVQRRDRELADLRSKLEQKVTLL